MAKKAKKSEKSPKAKAHRGKEAPKDLPPTEPTDTEVLVAGEAALAIAESGLAVDEDTLTETVLGHIEEPTTEPTLVEREAHAREVAKLLRVAIEGLRAFIQGHDFGDMPFIRVVGRVIYILTVDGPHPSCKSTPVIVAFLLYVPSHIEVTHQQPGCTRDTLDVTEPNICGVIHERLRVMTLAKFGLLEKGSAGHQLTETGRLVFDGWPPGIAFNPHESELWRRKKAAVRGSAKAR